MPINKFAIEVYLEAIYNSDPDFRIRALNILHNNKDYITIYEFENEYMATYNTMFSPLLFYNNKIKGIILNTLPYVGIKEIVEDHPVVGECQIIMVKLHK